MPPKSKQSKAPRKGAAKKKKRQRRPKQEGLNGYEAMIFDPCNAKLIPGMYGSDKGLLSRFKGTTTINTIADSGYIVWSPSFHSSGAPSAVSDHYFYNVFTWVGDAYTAPTLAGFGQSGLPPWNAAATTAAAFNDPAAAFVTSATAQDARVLSACLKLTYTGKMQDNRGQVCFVENFPLQSLYQSGAAGPATVDEIFNLSGNSQRLGVDTLEVVYRPDPDEDRFITNENGLAVGVAPEVPSVDDGDVRTLNPHCFGFAWRGMGSTEAHQIVLELIKNIEWRPQAVSGIVSNAPTSTAPAQVQKSLIGLDSKSPSWTRRTAGTAESIAAATSKVAWGAKNVSTTVSNLGKTFSNIMSIGASAAPFLALL